MNVNCTATVVHTNLEHCWTTVVELCCIKYTVSLHFNNYMSTFVADNFEDQVMSSWQVIAD